MLSKNKKEIIKALERQLPDIIVYKDGKSFIDYNGRGEVDSDVYVPDEILSWEKFIEILNCHGLDLTFKN